jgi:4a-hydroxytetrahydrobiopterin dehydratase
MAMLTGAQIAAADLTDWRQLAQALHARHVVDDVGTGARFVAAVGRTCDARPPPTRLDRTRVLDLELISDDAICRDGDGAEHVVEWVTEQDIDLARRITEVAADHQLEAVPSAVSHIELGRDTARSATIAAVWAALLTGGAGAQAGGSPSDEIRDLWFGDAAEHGTAPQRLHIEVSVASEVVEHRIAAAVAAGGTVVDDSDAPSLTVLADEDGNTGSSAAMSPPPRTRTELVGMPNEAAA